jgi:hypothetical protein
MKYLLILLIFISCNKPIPVHTVTVEIIETSTSVFHIVLSEQLPNPVYIKLDSGDYTLTLQDTKILSPLNPKILQIIYSDKNTVFKF